MTAPEDKENRSPTPIIEDPNEDRVQSPAPKLAPQASVESLPSRPASPIPPDTPSTGTPQPNGSQTGSPSSLIPTILTPDLSAETPDEKKEASDAGTSDDGKLSPSPSAMGETWVGTPSKGKSKSTGKNLSGWI